jgi:hypothetical protein
MPEAAPAKSSMPLARPNCSLGIMRLTAAENAGHCNELNAPAMMLPR